MQEKNTPPEPFGNIVQIGIVVRDMDRTLRVLTEVFGMGPFRVITWPPDDRPGTPRFYHGAPSNYRNRQAFADVGSIELELIQPLEGPSVWADFLQEKGEGIHHLKFCVSDLEATTRHLAEHGMPVTMMGAGMRPGTTWAYFGSEEGAGFVIEVLKALSGTGGKTPNIVDGKVQE